MSLWPFHHRHKRKNIAAVAQTIQGVQLSSAAAGLAIPIVYGQARCTGNLIHVKPRDATVPVGSSAADLVDTLPIAMALCEGPIRGLGGAWADKEALDATAVATLFASGVYFILFLGTSSQSPWAYLTSNYSGEAIPYQLTAYIVNRYWPSIKGASGGAFPNWGWEVLGLLPQGGGILDSNPKDVINDFLTDPNHGTLFPSSLIDATWLATFATYCKAAGIFISPVVQTQRPAVEHLQEWLAAANSAFVWSDGKLKIIPYGDQAITGNGVTYTPNVTPLYDLTDDDFVVSGPEEDPVHLVRRPQSDVYNMVQIEFDNRAKGYNGDQAEAKDQASIELYQLKPAPVIKAPFIKEATVARLVAQLALQRQVYIRNTYEFSLPFRYVLLEPMDLVTLTDANLGLNQTPVRLTEVDENEDGTFSCIAEEWPFGVATASAYGTASGAGYLPNVPKAPDAPAASISFDSTGQAILNIVGDSSTVKHIYVLRTDRLPTLAETRAGATTNFQSPSGIATGTTVLAGASVYVGVLAYNVNGIESPLAAAVFKRQGSGTSAPPRATIAHLNGETDDTVWNLRLSGVAGSGGGGTNLTWIATIKVGFLPETTFASGDGTALPNDIAQARDPRSTSVVKMEVTDTATGLKDTTRITVPSQRSEVVNIAGILKFKRTVNFTDNDGAAASDPSDVTGRTLTTGTKESGLKLVNRLLGKTLAGDPDSADGLPIGVVQRAVPFTVLRSSDNALLTSVDYAATVGGTKALSSAKREGIFFSETFGGGASLEQMGWSAEQTPGLGSVVTVATTEHATGGKVYQFAGTSGATWQYTQFPNLLPFNYGKLYRIRIRYRCTVNPTLGSNTLYAGVRCFLADGSIANNNAGNAYVCVAGNALSVAGGWVEQTGWFKGASLPFASSSPGYSGDPTAPTALSLNTAYIAPLLLIGYTGCNAVDQIDYFQIDELDEDASDRTYTTIGTGQTLKTAAKESGGKAVNRLFGKSLAGDPDTADSVANGSTKGVVVLNALDGGNRVDLSAIGVVNRTLSVLQRSAGNATPLNTIAGFLADTGHAGSSMQESGGKAINRLLGKALAGDPDSLDGALDGTTYKKIVSVNGSGQITPLSSAERFRAKSKITFSLAHNSPTFASPTTEVYDVGSIHDNVTNPSHFTVPTGGDRGIWKITGHGNFPNNATGYRTVAVYKNSALTDASAVLQAVAAGVNTAFQVTFEDDAPAVGDFYEVAVSQTSGIALNTTVTITVIHQW